MRFSFLLIVTALFCNSCVSSEQSHINNCSVPECINGGNKNLSSVILCNCCMAKGFSHRDTALLFHKFQQKLNSINDKGRKTFADLDFDVLSLIFEELDTDSMLKLLDASPTDMIFTVAKDTFWRRYKDYTVRIISESESRSTSTPDYTFALDSIPKRVMLSTSKAPKILRLFGNVIRHLVVQSPSTIISQYINKYLSGSLAISFWL